MHPATVTIDRVFSVERLSGRGRKTTNFGFASGASRHYSLWLPGWPAIEAGMEVTAILEKEGDWSTLRGWVDHGSGEVVAPSRGQLLFQLVASFVMCSLCAISWGDPMVYLLFLLYGLPFGFFLLRAHRVHKAIALISARPAAPAMPLPPAHGHRPAPGPTR
ncbi:hypothetical protein [Janthinobacterium sp. RB2R34]|uniref:hypothetical protein n=1 Tax=Janthinobacterium sp. RB2R34 TaxID=3424193 RepID=UPI003F21468F